MVDIANRHGDNCVFIGEDMEVAGAFGMNIALKNSGHDDKLLICRSARQLSLHWHWCGIIRYASYGGNSVWWFCSIRV